MTPISRYAPITALVLLLGAAPATLHAQNDGTNGPPQILVMERESIKPGKAGSVHQKSEASFVAAARANKAPFHYLALTSMTGPDRVLFLLGYASLAAWEAENKLIEKNPTLGASLDRAMVADGDILSGNDKTVWYRRDDLSLGNTTLQGARYMQIRQLTFKPGHLMEREEMVKLFLEGYRKVPGMHWSGFEQIYGTSEGTFITMSPMKSLSEEDDHLASDEKFAAAVGKEGLKRLMTLQALCVENEQVNLFRLNPKMSLPPDEWIKGDPGFWQPAPMKKPAPKPAQ